MGDGGEISKNSFGGILDRPHVVSGDCATRTFYSLVSGGTAGTFFGACQVAWFPDPVTSARGVSMAASNRTSSVAVARFLLRPTVWFALAGSTFSLVDCVSEEMRQKKDHWNSVLGGMAAGVVLGAVTKRFDTITPAALGLGMVMGLADYVGPSTTRDTGRVKSKQQEMLPKKFDEADIVSDLKEKYPQYKDL
mmetsp:Transcript_24737/g.57664  ORF Transcript_24737/g.57664 Transcript_24737/m.57664 type:complete len:193 (-) Transcript_24737:146-724(-)|eukprot:CAMPEP_0116823898 /NCGR_PEP_ID=MMETSP0418-20121206/1096_1 /TAXON_ID=1158023 /ORGANISM="Astrosyne radiata, Strain 13vi08-1A" /LENGTH=192 /DNA_ID=CAMNT_0004452207 /DNA_START=85 /DNA_END=663 /DNA_ORIENTATION=+